MSLDFTELDPGDISLALIRHHLKQASQTPSMRVHTARSGSEWAVVVLTDNETDPPAPLVIVHGRPQGLLVKQLLEDSLIPDRRYLFIVPNQLRPLLRSVGRQFEYGRQCLLYSCQFLKQRRPAFGVERVGLRRGGFAYRKLIAGKTVSEARVNWSVEQFAELGVYTQKAFRGLGYAKDVVFAITREILDSGKRPLYVVGRHNAASIAVCEALGYLHSGYSEYEAVGRYNPQARRPRSKP